MRRAAISRRCWWDSSGVERGRGLLIEHWPPRSHQSALGGIGLAVNPGDEQARAVIERFAIRAFRGRPAKPAYLDGLVEQFNRRRAAGEPFAEAIRTRWRSC